MGGIYSVCTQTRVHVYVLCTGVGYDMPLYIPSQCVSGVHISSTWIDVEDGSSAETVLNMDNLLQALIGCPSIPTSISEGIITFDYISDRMTSVNTCAPAINFSKLADIKNYSSFEEVMKNIIVGSYGLDSSKLLCKWLL